MKVGYRGVVVFIYGKANTDNRAVYATGDELMTYQVLGQKARLWVVKSKPGAPEQGVTLKEVKFQDLKDNDGFRLIDGYKLVKWSSDDPTAFWEIVQIQPVGN